MAKQTNMDMVNGPLTGKIIRFAVPLMLSGMLQLLYNAADVIVVGKFSGAASLAAVGSTGALVNLLINLFIGVSVGCNVLVARYYGARNEKAVSETVHCAMGASLLIGLAAGVIGLIFSTPLLRLMDSPEDVLPLASLYLKIYFCGMPFNIGYNFGAAVLRAVGDTKRPLYILSAAGLVNVVLNLVTVIVFKMDVAGVALATITSQLISFVLVVLCLTRRLDCCRLVLREIRLYKDKLLEMVRIGLPAGLQGTLFSLSNVIIQSSVNSFGSTVMAGNSAAANVEGFVYVAMNAVYQATITFVSQNLGAGNVDRAKKGSLFGVLSAMVAAELIGVIMYIFISQLLKLFISEPEAISYGITHARIDTLFYCMLALAHCAAGILRGCGKSTVPMVVMLGCWCVLRSIYVTVILQFIHEFRMISWAYPLTWTVSCILFVFYLFRLNWDKAAEKL